MASILLQYTASIGRAQSMSTVQAAALAAMTDILANAEGELSLLGMTANAPTVGQLGGRVLVAVTLTTNAQGDTQWPTADALGYATRGLFANALATRTPAKFAGREPIVTP